ncbi:hypothetical protein [Streptomyces sp. NRRL WC-3774]|nr:hypothetical protein [Streptomyces sp. NRRL WC-3774]
MGEASSDRRSPPSAWAACFPDRTGSGPPTGRPTNSKGGLSLAARPVTRQYTGGTLTGRQRQAPLTAPHARGRGPAQRSRRLFALQGRLVVPPRITVGAGKEIQVTLPIVSRVSTRSVAPADRIDFWEEHNRRALVGLTCSSYSQEGLLAAETNVDLGDVRLADISGNEHVVERTPRTCQSLPKDSIFVTLLTAGCGVFFHEGGCVTLRTGDLILYDTRRPYLFGFPSPMRQLLVDIPREVFVAQCAPGEVSAPILLGTGSAGRARRLPRWRRYWPAGPRGVVGRTRSASRRPSSTSSERSRRRSWVVPRRPPCSPSWRWPRTS